MRNKPTAIDRLLKLAEKQPILRVKDLLDQGIHPEHMRRLLKKGVVERTSRGVYRLAQTEGTEHQALAEVAKRVPHSVVCLISALAFHQIGTQLPADVWLAVERKAALPTSMNPRLRVVRLSGASFTEGIEEHSIEGVKVRVYNPAKTVVDCFKFRNKVGMDVAMEALRECWRGKKATMDQLWQYAKICRVDKVMRPYLEAIL
jgi:predicted transcriptional regulator of viral defense system